MPYREGTFRGRQFLCVLLVTFLQSKNFRPCILAFLSQRTNITKGRVDVLAKHCLKRLATIAKKGSRGKPPTLAEIEIASVFCVRMPAPASEAEMPIQDAASHPSTFGKSLNAVFRLKERTYPK
jgi:hypothetical protein